MKRFEQPECDSCQTRSKSLFSQINDGEVSELSYNKTCNLYTKGQTIFYEGNRPLGVYCLHMGKVKIFKTGFDGKDQIIRFGSPGDVLGYRALLCDDLYTATAIVLEDSTICFIGKQYFLDLMKREPCISGKLLLSLCHMLRDAEDKMTSLAQKPVRERVAEALLALNHTLKLENKSVAFDNTIILSREDLANVVGTATETLIRLLSDFKDEKLIKIEGRKITLLDKSKLTKIANIFD